MSTSKPNSFPLIYLLPLRLFVGLSFMIAGQDKISMGNWGAAYATKLYDFALANLDNAFSIYRPFLESVVMPNSEAFSVFVAWAELSVGLSIFFGLFTRLGGAFGIFLVLNYMLATGQQIWLPGAEAAYIWALFTLMICSAGRGLGADQILRSRKRIRLFT